MRTKPAYLFLILSLILPAVLFAGLLFGSVIIPPSEFWTEDGMDPVVKARFFRCCAAFAAGSSLAIAGAVYQAVLRNVLAEPFILGVSGGAALGAALAFISGFAALTIYAVPACAMAGGLLALGAVLMLGAGGRNGESLLLSGVIVGTVCSSVLMCLISFAGTREMCSITWWLMGDLASTDPSLTMMLVCSAPVIGIFLWRMSPEANALALGREYAWSVGVDSVRSSVILISAASVLAAQSVAVAGIISFVGLIIPHIIRKCGYSDNRFLFPASFLAGGSFLILCDILSRSVHPEREFQIGVITSLVGGPLFLWLLRSGRGKERS